MHFVQACDNSTPNLYLSNELGKMSINSLCFGSFLALENEYFAAIR